MEDILLPVRVLVVVIVVSGSAMADDVRTRSKKSESSALNAALGGTFAPVVIGAVWLHFDSDRTHVDETAAIALMASGFLFGPGLGHLYAGNGSRLLTGTLVRTACAGTMAYGAFRAARTVPNSYARSINFDQDESGLGYALYFFGILGFGAMTVYDFVTTGESVDAYNEQLLRGAVQVQPVMRVGTSSSMAGVRLTLRF